MPPPMFSKGTRNAIHEAEPSVLHAQEAITCVVVQARLPVRDTQRSSEGEWTPARVPEEVGHRWLLAGHAVQRVEAPVRQPHRPPHLPQSHGHQRQWWSGPLEVRSLVAEGDGDSLPFSTIFYHLPRGQGPSSTGPSTDQIGGGFAVPWWVVRWVVQGDIGGGSVIC